MAKSLVARASPNAVEVDEGSLNKPSSSKGVGTKSRITKLPNGKTNIETYDPENERIIPKQIDSQRSTSTDFTLQPSKEDELKSVLDRYGGTSGKGTALVPRDVGSELKSPGTGFTLGEGTYPVSDGKPPRSISGLLAGPEETEATFGKPKDFGQVISNITDYLKNSGYGDIAKTLLTKVVGPMAGTGIAVAAGTEQARSPEVDKQLSDNLDKAISQTDNMLGSDKISSSMPNRVDTSNLNAQGDAMNAAADNGQGAAPTVVAQHIYPDGRTITRTSDGALHLHSNHPDKLGELPVHKEDNAPTSSLEGSTGPEKGGGATQVAKKASPAVRGSNRQTEGGQMTDEDIHQWNLKHNPNYDSSLFDVATSKFKTSSVGENE